MADIVVVGSINVDLTVPVERMPSAGETVLGGNLRRGPGGKGANQAVAAARLGRQTAFVGAVGTDADGDWLASRLTNDGVDAQLVRREVATGHALIFVGPDGESTIVVSPGANGRLDASDVDRHAKLIRTARAVLAQLEIPDTAVESALRHASGITLLNPAPGRPLDRAILDRVTVLVPNRTELALIAGKPTPGNVDEIADLARTLDIETIVVTLGADGAVAIHNNDVHHIPARLVTPVDATAAGDSFCAALADALLDGADIKAATEWATRVAAVTVTRRGAQESLPTRAAVA